MTEQEFRDKLKQSVGHTGLSSDRQYRVLAGMHGKPATARSWGKMKIALAVGLVLLLMTGGAVAGSRYLVDWHGEQLQNVQTESDERMMQLREWRTKGKMASIVKWNEARETYTGVLASGLDAYVSSLEQLRSWVTADGMLPWPENIPAGYEMDSGSVKYVCGPEGEIRLRKQETTEDGYTISYFDMPQKQRFAAGYTVYLEDSEGARMLIQVNLVKAGEAAGHPMMTGDTFTELHVEGMQQAAAIESASQTRVALRQAVDPPLAYRSVMGYSDGTIREYLSEDDCLEIIIIGQGTPDALLAIFGLTAQ